MSEALNKLFNDFQNFEKGEIDVWDLYQNTHIHHDTTARNMYKFYEMVRSPENAVARGVSGGINKMDDTQKDCHTFVEPLVEYYDKNKKQHNHLMHWTAKAAERGNLESSFALSATKLGCGADSIIGGNK